MAITLCFPGTGALAATPQRKPPASRAAGDTKTYRWVDKDGVVHFGDTVPP